MKIPSEIEELIQARVFYAIKLTITDNDLAEWIDNHNIEVETCDYGGGVEQYMNPIKCAERIRQAILQKEEGGE